jgi:hypothetical protein
MNNTTNISFCISLEDSASNLTRGPGGLFTESNMWQSQP